MGLYKLRDLEEMCGHVNRNYLTSKGMQKLIRVSGSEREMGRKSQKGTTWSTCRWRRCWSSSGFA